MSHVDPHHASARTTLRALGGALLVVGSITSIVGLVRFLALFGTTPSDPDAANPALAVLMFGGGGMIAMTGFKLLFLGFAGRILRYGVAEALPPSLDAARATLPVAREVAREVGGGLREGLAGAADRPPRHSCGAENDADARFCKGCGAALAADPAPCPHCGAPVAATARSCDACGAPVGR
jgi:hypothetical protein